MAKNKASSNPNPADDPFTVVDSDGTLVCVLNRGLAQRQGVGPEAIQAIRLSHLILRDVRNFAGHDSPPLELRMIAAVIDSIETQQQLLWNFPDDPTRRRWFAAPGCLCPKMDNAHSFGTPFRTMLSDCPVHGELPAPSVASAEAGTLGATVHPARATLRKKSV